MVLLCNVCIGWCLGSMHLSTLWPGLAQEKHTIVVQSCEPDPVAATTPEPAFPVTGDAAGFQFP